MFGNELVGGDATTIAWSQNLTSQKAAETTCMQ
jgi:hypothetical protein